LYKKEFTQQPNSARSRTVLSIVRLADSSIEGRMNRVQFRSLEGEREGAKINAEEMKEEEERGGEDTYVVEFFKVGLFASWRDTDAVVLHLAGGLNQFRHTTSTFL
jgi:hypothetical protein